MNDGNCFATVIFPLPHNLNSVSVRFLCCLLRVVFVENGLYFSVIVNADIYTTCSKGGHRSEGAARCTAVGVYSALTVLVAWGVPVIWQMP